MTSHKFLSCTVFLFFSSFYAHAWSQRGHQTICQTAAFLTEEKELNGFLKTKLTSLGHLCNLPDSQWKEPTWQAPTGKEDALNRSHHYIYLDQYKKESPDTFQFSEVFQSYQKNHPGKIPGSIWWRAQQFFERASQIVFDEKSSSFSDQVYQFTVNLGLMGHYVGDNSQPYHVTIDLDGVEHGHAGIHSVWEHLILSAQPRSFEDAVYKAAKKLRKSEKWMRSGTLLERMKKLSELTLSDREKIEKCDHFVKPSLRESLDKQAPRAYALQAEELARSAALLAQFWDEAFRKVKSPPLQKDPGYRYPLSVEYIPADYFPKN